MKTYDFIEVQIVGRPSDFGYTYNWGQNSYSTPKEALKAGGAKLGHDDFIIGEFEGKKCSAVIIDGNRHTEKSEDFGEYVAGINMELGL